MVVEVLMMLLVMLVVLLLLGLLGLLGLELLLMLGHFESQQFFGVKGVERSEVWDFYENSVE